MTIKFEQSASSSALPTPPHSPPSQHPPFFALGANHQLVPHQSHVHHLHHNQPHPHHKHTATLLDSLTSFYQQEQYWVHHTRAALELALAKGIDGPGVQPLTGSSISNASSCDVSPAGSDVSCTSVRIKAEPESENAAAMLASPALSTSSLLASPTLASAEADAAHQQAASRWLRRKNQMRLRLEGISTNKRRRPARAPPTEPAARLLEMFAELVDARMESCVRMEKLVRDSGRGCAVC
ncbi:uncharacterized protein PHACADRAFT_249324 [Phanerochaete carnosa HHB-10118-sp]|uniref:Uncharacterized protein n=1 Tax=Phanerochaete carnosa (strain HHB-10118-sp) TaxID=650164 RepID=K5W5B1_PHACS|nr:uncharacterized protein PHACADRAFT_249324 [Phanerochaete carnosa HHB-10118-sp]EKM59103.1 hypothetical protein PHACADRAFT_249324 [Phanerochaete carnosa HHB-10118-sp]